MTELVRGVAADEIVGQMLFDMGLQRLSGS